jgi:phosphocarrier protein
MMLAAARGSTLVVETEGPDEQEALATVTRLITNRFEENE